MAVTTKLQANEKFPRKLLAHYLDENMGSMPKYVRIGKDLEAYSVAFNYDTETKPNILGGSTTTLKPPKLEASADTYYMRKDEKIGQLLFEKAMAGDTTGLRTTVIDAIFDTDGTCIVAYKHDCYLIPESVGGATDVNIPFKIAYDGNVEKGTMDLSKMTFSPAV